MNSIVKMLNPEEIRRLTAEAREKSEAKRSPMDERLQKISNHISAKFGCYSSATRELVEMMLECELPENSKGVVRSITVGAVIRDGDDVLYIITGRDSDGDAILMDEVGEGALVTRHDPDWHYATEEEVVKFLTDAGHELDDGDEGVTVAS